MEVYLLNPVSFLSTFCYLFCLKFCEFTHSNKKNLPFRKFLCCCNTTFTFISSYIIGVTKRKVYIRYLNTLNKKHTSRKVPNKKYLGICLNTCRKSYAKEKKGDKVTLSNKRIFHMEKMFPNYCTTTFTIEITYTLNFFFPCLKKW